MEGHEVVIFCANGAENPYDKRIGGLGLKHGRTLLIRLSGNSRYDFILSISVSYRSCEQDQNQRHAESGVQAAGH